MIDIFQYDFAVRALVAGVFVSLSAPLVGMFLVVRRYSLMADTLAHVSLVGVAAGIAAGFSPVIGAIVAALLAALGIEAIRTKQKGGGDSSMAIFLSGSLAIASVIISLSGGFNVNLLSYLFGSISTVGTADMWIIAAMSAIVVAAIAFNYRRLFAVAFDDELAQTDGINARLYGIAIVAIAAIVVSLAMRIVGVLLIGALMVIPVMTAMQFHRGFKATMAMSVVVSFVSAVSGILLSYYYDLASGGTIVVVSLVLFGLSLLVRRF